MGGLRRTRPLPSKAELEHLYLRLLLTPKEIGLQLGIGRRRIRVALDYYGIPVRKRGPRSPAHHGSWQGGRIVDSDGYVLLKMPDHPDASHLGYVREHRFVMERHLGRRLSPEEVVDHRNGRKGDNRLRNLRLFPNNAEHLRATLKGKCPKWTEDGKRRIAEGARRGVETRQRKAKSRRRSEPDGPGSS